jgi:hypothetical protein
VAAEEERGGGAYRRRDCSGEVVEIVGEVLRVTTMCGSPSGMVGVGRSRCAGGGARWQRGVRPNLGTIGQSNGSGSFFRDQGRHVREEFKNSSLDCSVYARRGATEVRRRWSWVYSEVLSSPSTWKASRVTGEANREADATWTRLERAGHGGRGLGSGGGRRKSSPELRRGVWPTRVSTGWGEARPGEALKARASMVEGEGAWRTWPDTRASARGLGERRHADQGRTRVRVHSSRVLVRVVIHPSMLLPWSVHKTSSPPYKLLILCGGHRIWPTGFKDLELWRLVCLPAWDQGKSSILSCLRSVSRCHLLTCDRGVS